MTHNRRLYMITILLILCQMFCAAATQQCSDKAEKSILGMMLRRHIFKRITGATFGDVCLRECYRDARCQSFNFVFTKDTCELSNRTKEARPEDFVPSSERYYFRRDVKRVTLGSIPELPAESCKEIKASEGAQADNSKYWLSAITPEKPVLAYCDMNTGDADECNASLSVCDLNAKCENTLDSYRCSCKDGFMGDGKSCGDVDECSQGSHDCIPGRASCTNLEGSYNCTCNNGYFGDGRTTCIRPEESAEECQNYRTLDSYDRKTTHNTVQSNKRCDRSLTTGWYRFVGAAGTRMPTSCVPEYRCGTNAPGWINGAHPTPDEGQVTRQVCFTWSSNCCHGKMTTTIRNCGSYYVYYLESSLGCTGYCGTD